MPFRSRLLLGFLACGVVFPTGCQRWRERWRNRDPYSAYPNDPFFQRRDQYPPGYPAPYPYYGSPPGGAPISPLPQGTPTPPEVLTPQPPPTEVKPPSSSMYRGPAYPPAPQATPRSPATTEPPLARKTPEPKNPQSGQPAKTRPLPPDLAEQRQTEPATIPPQSVPEKSWGLPVGIPFYFEVKENAAATGHRPDPEGLDWLKSHGFRTVFHLRQPGAARSADREQVEKHGLRYESLEMLPTDFGKSLFERFCQIVTDKQMQPVFVYDDDGTRAGPLWFAYLHIVEKLPLELARTRAELYGYNESGTAEQKSFAEALKRLLSENP